MSSMFLKATSGNFAEKTVYPSRTFLIKSYTQEIISRFGGRSLPSPSAAMTLEERSVHKRLDDLNILTTPKTLFYKREDSLERTRASSSSEKSARISLCQLPRDLVGHGGGGGGGRAEAARF